MVRYDYSRCDYPRLINKTSCVDCHSRYFRPSDDVLKRMPPPLREFLLTRCDWCSQDHPDLPAVQSALLYAIFGYQQKPPPDLCPACDYPGIDRETNMCHRCDYQLPLAVVPIDLDSYQLPLDREDLDSLPLEGMNEETKGLLSQAAGDHSSWKSLQCPDCGGFYIVSVTVP